MTTNTELWLTYHQNSRANRPTTAQLIELEFQNYKLSDLEDVLDHVFRQGFVEAKHRPLSWFECKNGQKFKGSQVVQELLKQGVGICQETALRLVIADTPPALWFTYVYLHNSTGAAVTQRVKLNEPHCGRLEKLAHVTNYIFSQGYLPPKVRPVVHWQGPCGRRLEECVKVEDLLCHGEGTCEDKPLRLVIDHAPCCTTPCH